MPSRKIAYFDGKRELEGHLVHPEGASRRRPAVLVAHAWQGQDDFARRKAAELAELGYVGLALDMYGKGIHAATSAEAERLMTPFVEDRKLLRQRVTRGFEVAQQQADVDPSRIAAIGFCFGGMCVLDLARAGAAVRGVVAFHGLLGTPDPADAKNIQARVLALHGHDDPFVPAEQAAAFREELNAAGVDWQMHIYGGGTRHAFSVPEANDEGLGTVYNPAAARRSWEAMKYFLQEVLGE